MECKRDITSMALSGKQDRYTENGDTNGVLLVILDPSFIIF